MPAFVVPAHRGPLAAPPRRHRVAARRAFPPVPAARHRRPRIYATATPPPPDGGSGGGSGTNDAYDAPATAEQVRDLLSSSAKKDQQRGLLLTRHLAARDALDLLLHSLETTTNDFIRDSAAVAIGQVDLSDAAVARVASRAVRDLLATGEEYSLRAAAAAAMGYMTGLDEDGTLALVESLSRALLEDADWQVHMSALASLGALRHARAVDAVTPWLAHENDLLVQAALGALGDIGDPSVVPHLLNQLGAADMLTRQRLAHALAQMPHAGRYDPSIVDALRTLSRDQSFVVREAATDALADMGFKSAVRQDPASEEQLIDIEVASLIEGDEAGDAGESANTALRRRLERSFHMEFLDVPDKPDEAPGAPAPGTDAAAPGEVRATTQAPLLEHSEQPRDDNASEQEFAAAVSELQTGDCATRALAAIKLRRFDAARALAAVDAAHALDPAHAPQRVRSACVGLLARAGATGRLIGILESDPEENVRSAVCDALMALGGDEAGATAACVRALHDDAHWLVRVSAAIALGTIAKRDECAEDALIRCLADGGIVGQMPPQQDVIRRHAVTALGFMGSRRGLQSFADLVHRGIDTPMRFRVAAALRSIPCADSVALARELVNDEDAQVAEMAQGSIDSLLHQGFE